MEDAMISEILTKEKRSDINYASKVQGKPGPSGVDLQDENMKKSRQNLIRANKFPDISTNKTSPKPPPSRKGFMVAGVNPFDHLGETFDKEYSEEDDSDFLKAKSRLCSGFRQAIRQHLRTLVPSEDFSQLKIDVDNFVMEDIGIGKMIKVFGDDGKKVSKINFDVQISIHRETCRLDT
jgi:hypothetical protein